ncbi:MAG: D-alanyl-D-alanine carboxypeptidase/D-alanyl-D-alanine-endopeptidase [Tannerella sp.]|nr:D-alanyl-D-alanine carboxypeptidase/D-alanyl-D-alanine-endopeptidase [Tannerella sp.]
MSASIKQVTKKRALRPADSRHANRMNHRPDVKGTGRRFRPHLLTAACLYVAVAYCFPSNVLPRDTPPPALAHFIRKPAMQGASVSLMVREVESGAVTYACDAERLLTPASVTKTVTTAAALELLGSDFRFATAIQYDGHIRDSILYGNLFIRGSGDPTLCSSEPGAPKDSIPALWVQAVEKAGIRGIEGRIVADESIFDTEGVSMKWLREDLGSSYGQGSYGINIFDNRFSLYLDTDTSAAAPSISHCEPPMPSLTFHNYLSVRPAATDSVSITGFPYVHERYLYGAVRAGHRRLKIEGDIPDPPLFAARHLDALLESRGIAVAGEPSSHRLLAASGEWTAAERTTLITTCSPPLEHIVRLTNVASLNMYADALVKTLGLRYLPQDGETISSFERGTKTVAAHWKEKGLNAASSVMYDGSGLAPANKFTTAFLCDMYVYMAKTSESFAPFFESLPRAGADGTVRTFLKGTALDGARLKSGSMTGVQGYGGYISKNGKRYAVALLVNNFSGKNRMMIRAAVEELLLSLFRAIPEP